jgi:hypothetical protein
MAQLYRNLLRLLTLALAGLALIRPMMDLAALHSVMTLAKDDYAAVQYARKSWAWFELIQLASFVSILVLMFVERNRNRNLWAIRGAFVMQFLMLALYFTFTLPINITTFHWTFFPDTNWGWLRTQWEYAHAVSAIIGTISFVLVLLDLISAKWSPSESN